MRGISLYALFSFYHLPFCCPLSPQAQIISNRDFRKV